MPELLLIFLTAGAAGAAKGAEAADRVRRAGDIVENSSQSGTSLGPVVPPSRLAQEVALRNLFAGSSAAQAVKAQLRSHRNVDDWYEQPLREGDRIALVSKGGGSGFAAPVTDSLSKNSRKFFESVQIPGKRIFGANGEISLPVTPAEVRIYEVRGGDMPAARAISDANPNFGAGGGVKVFIADMDAAIASQRLVPLDPHQFDPGTTQGRMEDARFRLADPDLPEHALDPDAERIKEAGKVGGFHAGRSVGGAALVASERVGSAQSSAHISGEAEKGQNSEH